MKELAATIMGMILVPMILWLFYSAVRTQWPENYVTASRDYGTVVNRTSGRYLLFRTVPAYCAALVVATTVNRFGGEGMISVLVGAGYYTCITQLRHVVNTWRKVYSHRRLPILLVSVAAAFCILISAALGGLGPGPLVAVVPPIDEFFKSFWTTILLALIAAAVFRYSRHQLSVAELVRRSRLEVGDSLLKFARNAARQFDAEPTLVEAILLTENLERPRWVRRLEELKAPLTTRGSYGIMQVQATRPLSDELSIHLAVRDHLAGCSAVDGSGNFSLKDLERALGQYNPNRNFVRLASAIYRTIYTRSTEDAEQQQDASRQQDAARQERKQERINLTATSYGALIRCLAAGTDGLMALSRLSIEDLRNLAEILGRIPAYTPAEVAAAKASLESGSGSEGGEKQRSASSSAGEPEAH